MNYVYSTFARYQNTGVWQKAKNVFPCDKWSAHVLCCAFKTFGTKVPKHTASKHNPINVIQTSVCVGMGGLGLWMCVRVMQACWTAALRPVPLDTWHFVLSCVTLKKDHNHRDALSSCFTLLIGYLTKRANVWHHHNVSDYSLSKNLETR